MIKRRRRRSKRIEKRISAEIREKVNFRNNSHPERSKASDAKV